ncbi:MAG: tRNA-specific adenosine deaminase [Blastocatellia bacterium]
MFRAIALARLGMENNSGGPFGCIITRGNEIIAEGCNRVTSTNDPTAHAEIVAIRRACEVLESFQLTGCSLFTSCEPCPMCLGAIYWARPDRIYIAATRFDAAEAGFDDAFIYTELCKTNSTDRRIPIEQLHRDEAVEVFREWISKPDKINY